MRLSLSPLLSLSLALASLTPVSARAEAPSAEDRGGARRLLEAGKTAFRAAKFVEAAKLFGEAYAKDPSLDAALYNQAYALRRAERYAEARDAYRRYLERHPDDLDTQYALGRTAQLLGDHEEARERYETYVEKETRAERARYVEHAKAQLALLPPKAPAPEEPVEEPAYDTAARFSEAMKLYQEKRYAEAAALFLEVYEHDEKHTRALYRHALALRQAKQLDAARAAYERFLKVEPSDPDAVYGLAETERAAGQLERAISLYERYLEVEKRPSEERWRERAREYVALLRAQLEPAAPAAEDAGESETTVAAVEPPAEAPAALPAHGSFGPSDAHRPRLVRVASLTSSSEETPPSEPPAPDLVALLDEGEAKLAAKDAKGALLAFQRALVADPSSARPHWGLARAYELAGQNGAAKHHYRLYRERPAADREKQKADAAWWKIETLP